MPAAMVTVKSCYFSTAQRSTQDEPGHAVGTVAPLAMAVASIAVFLLLGVDSANDPRP